MATTQQQSATLRASPSPLTSPIGNPAPFPSLPSPKKEQAPTGLPPLVITPKTILMAILKFLFICANVAFAIYAVKVVFCSTFFITQPTQWLSSEAGSLTSTQRELAGMAAFGSRFMFCVKKF